MEKPNLVSIAAEPRETGAKAADALRAGHQIPAVLYGPHTENIHFSIKELDLERLLKSEDTQFVKVDLGDASYRSLIKKVDFHPLTDRPLHADFYVIDEKIPVTVTVPLRLTGTSPGIMAGGRRDNNLKKVKVRCLPDNIPAHVLADISGLNIGETLRIKDLNFDGMSVLAEPDRTVVLIKPPRGGKKVESGKK